MARLSWTPRDWEIGMSLDAIFGEKTEIGIVFYLGPATIEIGWLYDYDY